MRSEKQKLMIIFQGLWMILSLPLTSLLAKALDCHNLPMLLFFYILITYPAWINNAWNWYKGSDNEELPKKLIYFLLTISVVSTVSILEYFDWGGDSDDIVAVMLPILCFVVFISLNTNSPKKAHNLIKKITKIICLRKKLIISLSLVIMMILGSIYFVNKKMKDDEEKRATQVFIKENFDFTPYTQKQKEEALSIQEFINGLDGLTKAQQEQTDNNNIIVSGIANLTNIYRNDYIKPTKGEWIFANPSDSDIGYGIKLIWHNKSSKANWQNRQIPIGFRLQQKAVENLYGAKEIKFIGRLKYYSNIPHPLLELWQVEIEEESSSKH